MSKYRKKPVVVDAFQWFKNGDHPDDGCTTEVERDGEVLRGPEGKVVRYFRCPKLASEAPCAKCGQKHHIHGWIETLEGGHIVCPGDWIITGVQGERYPCKPDIFAATYEPVD
jgi:hypothetical protein